MPVKMAKLPSFRGEGRGLSYNIAGFRNNKKDYNCGTLAYVTKFKDETRDIIKKKFYSCVNPSCPTCWKSWAIKEGRKAGERLEAFSRLSEEHDENHIKHVVVSVPKHEYKYYRYKEGYRYMRNKAKKISEKRGFETGKMVFHPNRIKKNFMRVWKKERQQGITTLGKWAWIIKNRLHDIGTYFSPHYHLVGWGWIVGPGSEEFVNDKGEVVDNPTIRKKMWVVINLGTRPEPIGLFVYLLSHAGLIYDKKEGNQSYKTRRNIHSIIEYGSIKNLGREELTKNKRTEIDTITDPVTKVEVPLHDYTLRYREGAGFKYNGPIMETNFEEEIKKYELEYYRPSEKMIVPVLWYLRKTKKIVIENGGKWEYHRNRPGQGVLV